MELIATIVIENVGVREVEDLLEQFLDDYFTYFNFYSSGSDLVVEVHSEDLDAGDQTADFLEANGYYIVEYINERN
mgnify:CR=1 FL=1